MMKVTTVVDTSGMACPMPIVQAKKALEALESGEVMAVISTDKGSLNDFQAWVKKTNHEMVGQEEEQGVFKFYVRKR
ncbi:hypothetical protein J27TS7_06150 [Paenibacillus dendritiformis]|nr:hypothetical protein J27TS7_06150 [Paenibacillus dendritiformis]